MSRHLTWSAGALLAAGLIAAALWPQGREGEPAVLFGFNNNAVTQGVATPEQSASLLARAGARIDRVQVDWSALEPERGRRLFEPFDRVYAADLRYAIRPLFIFAYAPDWATSAACAAAQNGCHAAPAPEHVDDGAATVAAIAERYPRLAGIEIWNEPNAPYFWAPQPDAGAYGRLLVASAAALDRVGSRVPLIAPAVSDSPGFVEGHIPAPDFVSALVADGALEHADAVSVHAYPDPGDPTGRTAAEDVDAVLDTLGDDPPPVWVTETGASTTGLDAVTEPEQAVMLQGLAQALPSLEPVDAVMFHTLIDPPTDPAGVEHGFGVIDGRRAKPAFCALAERLGGTENCD